MKDKYGSVAISGLSSEHDGVRAVAEAFGYSEEGLAFIPAESNMGLSCGNPTATANLREGEVVVDLGSGGGLDVLLALGTEHHERLKEMLSRHHVDDHAASVRVFALRQ